MSAIARTAAQLNLNPTLTALINSKDVKGLQKQGLSRANAVALAKGDARALQALAKKNPKLLQALKARAEVPAGPTGIVVDKEKKKISGSAMSTMVDGHRAVEIPGFGQLPAPDPGKLSSFLVSEDKLMSLKTDANGMVTVNTRTLELKSKGSGFKGDLLPDPTTGKVNVGGKEIDVSGLKPGKTKKVKVKINGKKYKLKLKLNEDGSVNVEGKRNRGLFGSIIHGLGKVVSFAGKFAPLLMAIPGAGLAAAIGKGLSIASSVKGVIDSVRTGNWLGALGSLAGGIANFGRGAFAAAANTVSKVAHFGQSVVDTLKYGLGKGLLPIIANGANLLSGAAGIFGKNNLANVAGQVSSYASVADAALKGNFGPALQKLVNELGPDVIKHIKEQQQKGSEYSIYKGVTLKPFDFQNLPDFDWANAQFTLPGGSYAESEVPDKYKNVYASNGGFYADAGGAKGAAKQTPAQQARQAVSTANTIHSSVGLHQSSLDMLLRFSTVAPTQQNVTAAAMTYNNLVTTRNFQFASYTAGIAEMKKARDAAFRAGDSKTWKALDASIDAMLKTRSAQLNQMNRAISTTAKYLNENARFLNSPMLKNLKALGDGLNVAGAGLTTVDAMLNGPQQDWRARLVAAVGKGGTNYGMAVATGSVPPVAVALAVDSLFLGGNVQGTMNNAVDFLVGAVQTAGGDTSTLERLLENNRNGKNGWVVQQFTRFGDWINTSVFGN